MLENFRVCVRVVGLGRSLSVMFMLFSCVSLVVRVWVALQLGLRYRIGLWGRVDRRPDLFAGLGKVWL